MRIFIALAIAAAVASPALAQQRDRSDGYARYRGDDGSHRRDWRSQEPTQHWSQFYGRSYGDTDSWTPNSANGG